MATYSSVGNSTGFYCKCNIEGKVNTILKTSHCGGRSVCSDAHSELKTGTGELGEGRRKQGGKGQGWEKGRPQRAGTACRGEWPNPPITVAVQSRRGSPVHQPAWSLGARPLFTLPAPQPPCCLRGLRAIPFLGLWETTRRREWERLGVWKAGRKWPVIVLVGLIWLLGYLLFQFSAAVRLLGLSPWALAEIGNKHKTFQSLQNSMAYNESLATIRDR